MAEKPVPNLVRYGFGNGFVGADVGSLFLGGEERYAEDNTMEIKITNKNRGEIVAVLRELADFVEQNTENNG